MVTLDMQFKQYAVCLFRAGAGKDASDGAIIIVVDLNNN